MKLKLIRKDIIFVLVSFDSTTEGSRNNWNHFDKTDHQHNCPVGDWVMGNSTMRTGKAEEAVSPHGTDHIEWWLAVTQTVQLPRWITHRRVLSEKVVLLSTWLACHFWNGKCCHAACRAMNSELKTFTNGGRSLDMCFMNVNIKVDWPSKSPI